MAAADLLAHATPKTGYDCDCLVQLQKLSVLSEVVYSVQLQQMTQQGDADARVRWMELRKEESDD